MSPLSNTNLPVFSPSQVWVPLPTFFNMPFTHNDLFFIFDRVVFNTWVTKQPDVIKEGAISHDTINHFFAYLKNERVFKSCIESNTIRLLTYT